MTRPVLLFPHAARQARDDLRAELASRPETFVQGVTVSTKPRTGSDDDRPLPYVQVTTDGGVTLRRIRARDSLRVLAYADDEGDTYALADLCRAVLEARGYLPRTRPQLTTDPDTGEPLATVGVDAVTAPMPERNP